MPEVTEKRSVGDVVVGCLSRIDYGGKGYRQRLLERGRQICQDENTQFDVLVGGLVDKNGIKKRIEEAVIAARKKNRGKPVNREAVKEEVLDAVAAELARCIPVRKVPGTEKAVRLYVMTSPAYDGEHGHRIAERLARIRADIRHWAKLTEHLPLKPPPHEKFQEIACLVPRQQVFRSKYDSTAPDRVVADYFNIANKRFADVILVGCYGVCYYKPMGGESSRPIIGLPNLHRIEENRASENQVGVTVVQMTKGGDLFVRNHNLNALVVKERLSINISPKYRKDEQLVLEQFRHQSSWTVGLLTEKLKKDGASVSREDVEKTLKRILKKKRLQPPLGYDETSQRYFIPRDWIQKNLSYPYPWPEKNLVEERFIGFGCMHALCRHTAHEFMVEELPKLILRYNVTHIVGGGDFIEGRAHGLPENGELLFGADYVQQEAFAADLVATPILKAFKVRLAKFLETVEKKRFLDEAFVMDAVKTLFVYFWYIAGNHDEWTQKVAFPALTFFRTEFLKLLRQGTAKVLRDAGLVVPTALESFLEERAIRLEPLDAVVMPSGLSLSLNHLHMARAQTKTLRSQALLEATQANINFHANFHTALAMARFDPEMGQRVVQQLGTLKLRSAFEDRKGKKVDFGVGYLRIGYQAQGERRSVLMHEVAFFGDPSKYGSVKNETFIGDFRNSLEKSDKKQ